MRVALAHLARGVDLTPASPAVDHLGLASIAGQLRARGHEVVQIDSGLQELDDASFLAEVVQKDPECVGLAVNYANITDTLKIARQLRNRLPGGLLLAGGPYATFHTQTLLKSPSPFDGVVLGEGEAPMLELAAIGTRLGARTSLPGIAWRESSDLRPSFGLRSLPFSDLAPADRSMASWLPRFRRGAALASVEASRGCSHKCRFCSISAAAVQTPGMRRRVRNVESVATEMSELNRVYGLADFWFMDADFLGPLSERSRILALADLIGGIGPVTIEIDTRTDAICVETIRALRRVGLKRAFLGVESFHDDTLISFNKGTTAAANRRAVDILQAEGIRPILGTILFHPRSTLEQLQCEHHALSAIGYQNTQGLFRLKKYRGTADAGTDVDGEGRGVSPDEDYGWEFTDSRAEIAWKLFDRGRLQLMHSVFAYLGPRFRHGTIDADQFNALTDRVYTGMSDCMDLALAGAMAHRGSKANFTSLAADADELATSLIVAALGTTAPATIDHTVRS